MTATSQSDLTKEVSTKWGLVYENYIAFIMMIVKFYKPFIHSCTKSIVFTDS